MSLRAAACLSLRSEVAAFGRADACPAPVTVGRMPQVFVFIGVPKIGSTFVAAVNRMDCLAADHFGAFDVAHILTGLYAFATLDFFDAFGVLVSADSFGGLNPLDALVVLDALEALNCFPSLDTLKVFAAEIAELLLQLWFLELHSA